MDTPEVDAANETALEVRIIDDDDESAERWAVALGEGANAGGVSANVEAIPTDKIGELVDAFDGASVALRAGGSKPLGWAPLDDCDVLIIDSDLREAKEFRLSTGQDMAYATRTLTDVPVVAVLNAFGERPFDLTLKGQRESFADLHLGANQLELPGLWACPADHNFRPWYWPLLQGAARRQRARVGWLLDGGLEEKIIDVLGFGAAEIQNTPRTMRSFLSSETGHANARPFTEVTFKEFSVRSRYALQRKDAKAVEEHEDATVMARVAAARVSYWLNRVVAVGQDVLVDGPHLAERFPSQIIDGRIDDTTKLGLDATAPRDVCEELGLHSGVLAKHTFNKADWCDRPLWWGRRLEASRLSEATEPWTFEELPRAFCEDSSSFVEREAAQRFNCDVETPYRQRWIKRFDCVAYQPAENLI